ncbi:hypothetical protein WJX73_004089 [Symbiochloris irregularis]|uniref:Uncharacterized protein n=1 Tax=Symbiochloris irregularis TaxID=706552 RepID=A0AAW1P402_9CHLO
MCTLATLDSRPNNNRAQCLHAGGELWLHSSKAARPGQSCFCLGLRGDLRLQGASREEAEITAQVLAALISQRRQDAEHIEQMEAAAALMQSDFSTTEGTRQRLQSVVHARDRALGQLENQLRSVTEEARVNLEAVVAQRDDAVKKNADLRRRHAHFQHEIRRKEQDYERLQVKLRELLMEKSREARANMEAAAAFSRGLRSKAPRSQDIQKLMAAHKAELSELQSENQGLKAALDGLQSQHASLINLQSAQKRPRWAAEPLAELQFLESVRGLSPQEVLDQLSGTMQSLQQRLAVLGGPTSDASPQAPASMPGRVSAMQSLLVEQDTLATAAVAALRERLAQQDESRDQHMNRGPPDSPPIPAKLHSALKSAMSLTPPSPRESPLQERQREELRRAQADVALERERLQAEAAKLAAGHQELAAAAAAFKEAAEKLAPGLGAGSFLASAVGREALKGMRGCCN